MYSNQKGKEKKINKICKKNYEPCPRPNNYNNKKESEKFVIILNPCTKFHQNRTNSSRVIESKFPNRENLDLTSSGQ